MLTALVKRIKEHPILSIVWGLFASSFLYMVHEEYSAAQQVAALRTSANQVQHKLDDLRIAENAVNLRDVALRKVNSHDWSSLGEDLKRDLKGTTERVVRTYDADRRELEKVRIVIASLYVEDDALKDVQSAVVKDLEQMDAFLARRNELMTQAPDGPEDAYARWLELRENKDGLQYGMEADARSVTNDHILDRVRENYNVAAASYNADSSMFRWRSRLMVAAAAYMGACIGGFGGWLIRRWRCRAKPAPAEARAVSERSPSPPEVVPASSAR